MCIFVRYLEWRVTVGKGFHPLLELRARFGGQTRPIVLALLSKDYKNALEGL
jgi:hypothetical protein